MSKKNDKLRVLNLARNRIHLESSKTDRERWKNFEVLAELDLSSNLLHSIPLGLCELKSLRELRLINNRIKEIPNELFRNTELRVLILNANPIE